MRANHDVSRRLSFDSFSDLYDAARPRLDVDVTAELLEFAGIAPGQRVLEIGAGTGQWLDALVQCGLVVEALEPGDSMRALAEASFGPRGVTLHEGDFEHFAPRTDAFDALLSANAFHWVDPLVGYPKARELLRPGGALLLVWNFVSTGDDNRIAPFVAAALPQEHSHLAALLGVPSDDTPSIDGGRHELRASGLFEEPRWSWFSTPLEHDAASLVDLLASYATDAPMSVAERRASADELTQRLAEEDLASMRNHVYALTARAR